MAADHAQYFALADSADVAMVPQQSSLLDDLNSMLQGSGGPATAQSWTSAELVQSFKGVSDNDLDRHLKSLQVMDHGCGINGKLPDNGVKAARRAAKAQAEVERRRKSKDWLQRVLLTCQSTVFMF